MGDGAAIFSFWQEEVLNFFQDEVRIHGVRHSHLIVREVGAHNVLEIIRERVLPMEINDAVFHALAETLGQVEFESSHEAIQLLNWLLEFPEKLVRNTAVKSLLQHAHRGQALKMYPGLDCSRFDSAPVEKTDDDAEESKEMPLVLALCNLNRFKSFFQRMSVCAIISQPVVSGLSPEEERNLFLQLCKDSVPQVRVAVTEAIGKIWRSSRAAQHRLSSPISPSSAASKEARLLDMRLRCISPEALKELMLDPDDLVQAAAVEHCLCMLLTNVDQDACFTFLREEIVHSLSWRVRFAVAKQIDLLFEELIRSPPSNGTEESEDMDVDSGADKKTEGLSVVDRLRNTLVELFTDPEPDVRAQAAKSVKNFMNDNDDYVTVIVGKLVDDEDPEVRKSMLSSLEPLAKQHPMDVTRFLNKMIMTESEPEVRTIAVQTAFSQIIKELPDADRLSIIRNIYGITCSAEARSLPSFSWRTKTEAVKAIPLAVRCLPREVWTKDAAGLHFFKHSLQDTVHAVREMAIAQLEPLAKAFGYDWVKENICPLPEILFSKPDYRVRICALELLHELYKVQCFTDNNADVVRAATADMVPNVRSKAKLLFPNLV